MAALASLTAVVHPWRRRAGALAVAVALAGATTPAVSLAAPDQAEVERLYVEGQDLNEAKDYKGAAQVWTRLLNILEESGDNQELRESLVINILEAHIAAYNQVLDANGKKDPAHIFTAKATLDQYYADFQSVHGDRKAISAMVQEAASEVERLYEEIMEKRGGDTDGPATTDTDDPTGTPPPVTTGPPPPRPNNDNGLGLILGGAGLGVLGIGAIVLIPVGSALGKEAEDDYDEANEAGDDGDLEDANRKGERANALLIAGAVAGPLLLGGAAVLIALGVKKRNSSALAARPRDTIRASPAIGRTFSGVSISGRF